MINKSIIKETKEVLNGIISNEQGLKDVLKKLYKAKSSLTRLGNSEFRVRIKSGMKKHTNDYGKHALPTMELLNIQQYGASHWNVSGRPFVDDFLRDENIELPRMGEFMNKKYVEIRANLEEQVDSLFAETIRTRLYGYRTHSDTYIYEKDMLGGGLMEISGRLLNSIIFKLERK